MRQSSFLAGNITLLRSVSLFGCLMEVVLTTDIWAIGCIFAELLSLRPIFKGDEAKLDSKKTLPFQRDQMGKICDVLGPVKRELAVF